MMICFSLFPDNGDTFHFGIPLKVYKCNLKIFLHQSYFYYTLPIAAILQYYFRILILDQLNKIPT